MPVRLIGLSHHTAPVEVRERIAFASGAALQRALTFLNRELGGEIVLISTCNRTELYLAGCDAPLPKVVLALLSACDVRESVADWLPYFEEKRGHRAVERLFRVAAGLDSMMLGEMDIVRQVKDAYSAASDAQTVGGILNPLFHDALRVAKRARTETGLGRGAFGIGHAAATVAQSIFGTLSGRTVLILGAGAMSETTARHLSALGVTTIVVANRTYDRAIVLAESLNGRAVRYEQFAEQLAHADIVIASTSAPGYVVTREIVASVLKSRRSRPLYLIDIAVPRDIEPSVGDLANVYLYNIDHFEAVVDADLAERRQEAEKAEKLVRDEAVAFAAKMQTAQTAVPLVSEVRAKLDTVSQAELVRLRKKLSHLPEADWMAIEAFARGLQNKIAHAPSVRIREYAEADSHDKIEAVRELFALDAEPVERK